MQLSRRLHAVASLVSPGYRVADVGCDHAYTSIYLAEQGISPHIIAMDVNQGPIDRAKENISRYGCQDKIETRRSDGLEKLQTSEVDAILIGGMGGALTIQILKERPDILREIKELILQPQSEISKVRSMLTEYGFLIIRENMVKEDGKYYVMLKAMKEESVEDRACFHLSRTEHFSFGRLLLESKHPILKEFLHWELGLCDTILESLKGEQTENASSRRREIEEKLALIHCGLEYYR